MRLGQHIRNVNLEQPILLIVRTHARLRLISEHRRDDHDSAWGSITVGVRTPNLPDLASNGERVRNCPADRAVRIVHGMIELLIELKERTEATARATWALLCVDYDRAGRIPQVFFQELMRRAGARLHLL